MKKMIKNIAALILILILTSSIYGQKISYKLAHSEASSFLKKVNVQFDSQHQLKNNAYFNLTEQDENLAHVFNLSPAGYIIVSSYFTDTPIIGFSLKGFIPDNDEFKTSPAFAVIKSIVTAHKFDKSQNTLQDERDEIYGPWLSTVWGQVNCYDINGYLINVTNLYTPNNYAVGCVAISLSSMLHYYQWPPKGHGSHSYYDGYGSSNGTYSANFGQTYYSWDLMLDRYYNMESTMEERQAAGELAYHAAVALEMDFEYNGSTSNVNRIPGTGSDYFRFYSFYKQENNSIFWPRLDKNVQEGNPIILAVQNNSGFGHSVVCDGLWISSKDDSYYHLSMGWWGASDGWYTIKDNFNAGGYTSITGGILDFIPVTYLHPAQMPNDQNMFNLAWEFSQSIEADAFEVQRKINNGSWEYIAEDYNDTTLLVIVNDIDDAYSFRVRAKVNGEFYPSTWSNTIQLDIISGLSNPKKCEFQLSPNPCKNTLYIESNEAIHELKIWDFQGQLVYNEKEIQPSQYTIPVSDLKSGTYILEVSSETKNQVFKFIKQ